jgi:hypothetical protein
MAITTYAELQTAVADFLNRDDLTATVPTFIGLVEDMINRDVRHWRMENRAQGEIDGQFLTRPTDWVETIRFHITGNGTTVLNLISGAAMAEKRAAASDTSGRPVFYCNSRDRFELYPSPDTDLYVSELLYYQKLPALSDTNTSNWLLEEAADVYLYGALMHSAPYLQEDERGRTWGALYASAVERLNSNSDQAKWSGSGLTMKIKGLG